MGYHPNRPIILGSFHILRTDAGSWMPDSGYVKKQFFLIQYPVTSIQCLFAHSTSVYENWAWVLTS
jgi:hypothetical protein